MKREPWRTWLSCAVMLALSVGVASAAFEDIEVKIDQDTDKEFESYDDQKEYLKFKLMLKNKRSEAAKGKVTVFIVGENAGGTRAKKRFAIIDILRLDYSMKGYGDTELVTEEVENTFDHYYITHGAKYYGVLVVVEDENKKIVVTESNKSKLKKLSEVIQKTRKGHSFED